MTLRPMAEVWFPHTNTRRLRVAMIAMTLAVLAGPRTSWATCPDFAPPVSYTAGNGPRSVAIGDFNGDGKRDVVVANLGASTVSILLGNGNGTFAAKADFGTGTGSNPASVAVGDFNGDGTLWLRAP